MTSRIKSLSLSYIPWPLSALAFIAPGRTHTSTGAFFLFGAERPVWGWGYSFWSLEEAWVSRLLPVGCLQEE